MFDRTGSRLFVWVFVSVAVGETSSRRALSTAVAGSQSTSKMRTHGFGSVKRFWRCCKRSWSATEVAIRVSARTTNHLCVVWTCPTASPRGAGPGSQWCVSHVLPHILSYYCGCYGRCRDGRPLESQSSRNGVWRLTPPCASANYLCCRGGPFLPVLPHSSHCRIGKSSGGSASTNIS